MNIPMIGAAGMIGRKRTAAPIQRKILSGESIDGLIPADIIEPARPEFSGAVETLAVDFSDPVRKNGWGREARGRCQFSKEAEGGPHAARRGS